MMSRASQWASRFFAVQTDLSHRRLLLSAASALVTVGLVAWVSQFSLSGRDLPFMVASVGASAVLLFVIPSSTLSSPWAFAGGHLVSVIVGVSCAQWIPYLPLAMAMAVGLSILAMFYLRCLHPPGGAIGLLAVVGGEPIQKLGYQFVLTPVMLNVVIMLGCAMIYWRLAKISPQRSTGNSLGLDHDWQRGNEEWLEDDVPFRPEDLSHAMADMDTFLDISHHNLNEIYARALHQSHKHALRGLRCGEIMSQPVISVEYGTELASAWLLFEKHNIRGMPVVDSFRRVQGIITVKDFVRIASKGQVKDDAGLIEMLNEELDEKRSMAQRLVDLRQRTPGFESSKPEVVGQLMTAPVILAQVNDFIADLMPLFSQNTIHHMPIVDDSKKLVGILTREDIMSALEGKTI